MKLSPEDFYGQLSISRIVAQGHHERLRPQYPVDLTIIVIVLVWGFVLKSTNSEVHKNIDHMANSG